MKEDVRVIKNQKAFTLYHGKFVLRLMIFLASIMLYVLSGDILKYQIWALLVWAMFAIEMILKLFPSKFESMGSQKQFKANFEAAKENVHVKIEHQKRVILIALMWLVLNGVIAHFYFKHIIDEGIMIIISMFYSVCDMICVLFFCPFQRIMANKCCTTCRIHNWDYVMMFTPMVFVDNIFAISLFCLGAIIFIKWEYTVWKHPERFCEETNANLTCANCKETRCSRKGVKRV